MIPLSERYGTACFLRPGDPPAFIKVYLYDGSERVNREFQGALAAYVAGVQVPRPLRWGRLENGLHAGKWFVEYRFILFNDGPAKLLPAQAHDLVRRLRTVTLPAGSKEFPSVSLAEWNEMAKFGWDYLMADSPSVHPPWWKSDPFANRTAFIHGDLSPENLALTEEGLWVFDFGDCNAGPPWWDAAYLAGLLGPGAVADALWCELPAECGWAPLLTMTVRLGRALRKDSDIEARASICRQLLHNLHKEETGPDSYVWRWMP